MYTDQSCDSYKDNLMQDEATNETDLFVDVQKFSLEEEMERVVLQQPLSDRRQSRSGSTIFSNDHFTAVLQLQASRNGSHSELASLNTSISGDRDGADEGEAFEPEFRRVTIVHPVPAKDGGSRLADIAGTPEDAARLAEMLIDALELRQRYMQVSQQPFFGTTGRFLSALNGQNTPQRHPPHRQRKRSIEGKENSNPKH
ncbi:hypothetical protein RvY_01646 [Ramazzottius varieornatus]|uniref:Uncharacterized protein n=1 Tax=Ramazzottius varieornatus TaxID=947166 RepID=A0A1D1UKH3_RAMVA|nr:hypothetical protein RvY_01646 [Ramazzottius varieornatus]